MCLINTWRWVRGAPWWPQPDLQVVPAIGEHVNPLLAPSPRGWCESTFLGNSLATTQPQTPHPHCHTSYPSPRTKWQGEAPISNHHHTELRKASIKHFYCNKTWNWYVVRVGGGGAGIGSSNFSHQSLHRTAKGWATGKEKPGNSEISRGSWASKNRRCWSCDDQHHFLKTTLKDLSWWLGFHRVLSVYKQHLQFKLSIKVLKI